MEKRPLTILHTESHRAWGGQEIRVLTECLWMRKKGHRPILVASKKSKIYYKAKEESLEVLPMAFTNLSAPGDVLRLRGWFRRYTPDVLNTHGNMDAKVGLLAAKGMHIPCVIRSRHHSHPVSPSWHNKWMYRRLSDYIFTSAQCIADQIASDLDVASSKMATVSSGFVPPESLLEKEEAVRRLQEEFGLDQKARFIGSVAMLAEWKGHHVLIDAFASISERFPDHHLMIVGDGSEMQSLVEHAKKLKLSGRIHFAGFREDPWPFFRAFDINILASTKNEATSQVLPQAMYARCPVIGTNAGGIPEVVEDGKDGLIVEPSDSAALADAIQTILTSPEKTAAWVESAYQKSAGFYTMDMMIERILKLYQRAFEKKGGAF